MENHTFENRPKKRSRTDVIFDILKILQENKNKIKPTHLMYKANLSHETLGIYIRDLKKSGLIKEIELEQVKKQKRKRIIQLTHKGFDFYLNYSKMKEFERTFGI